MHLCVCVVHVNIYMYVYALFRHLSIMFVNDIYFDFIHGMAVFIHILNTCINISIAIDHRVSPE